MPSRGSGFETAVASTTLSPMRTTPEPCACLASLPVSNLRFLPPESSTLISVGSGFMIHPSGQGATTRAGELRVQVKGCQSRNAVAGKRTWQRFLEIVQRPPGGGTKASGLRIHYDAEAFSMQLLADAEFRDDALIAL